MMIMKRIYLLGLLLLSATLLSGKKFVPSAEVNYLSGDAQTVTVRSVGFGKNVDKATLDAEQKVFEVLFFRGLPESVQKMPLAGSNESEVKSKHKQYFDDFFNKQRHATFVMSAIPVSEAKVKGGRTVTLDVRVNVSALRNDLEASNVIRKFGF